MTESRNSYLDAEAEKDLRRLQTRGKTLSRSLKNEISLVELNVEEFRIENKKDEFVSEHSEAFSKYDRNLLFFEMEVKKKIIQKIQIWCRDLDDWALLNLAKPKLLRGILLPKRTAEIDSRTFVTKCALTLSTRMQFISNLIGDAASVSSPDHANRESAGGWRHLRDLDIFDDHVLDAYLSKIGKRSTPTQRENAIGAAKELLEALARGILEGDFSDAELSALDLPGLFKKLRIALSVDSSLPPALGGKGQGLDQVIASLSNVVSGIANLRNTVGSGHGRPRSVKGLTEMHVVLVVDSTYALSRFVAGLYRLEL